MKLQKSQRFAKIGFVFIHRDYDGLAERPRGERITTATTRIGGKASEGKLKKNSRNFRVNREMREKNRVYNHILDKFWAKSSSKCKIELCQNFKFWCMKSKFEFGNRFLRFKTKLHKFDLPIPLESDLET